MRQSLVWRPRGRSRRPAWRLGNTNRSRSGAPQAPPFSAPWWNHVALPAPRRTDSKRRSGTVPCCIRLDASSKHRGILALSDPLHRRDNTDVPWLPDGAAVQRFRGSCLWPSPHANYRQERHHLGGHRHGRLPLSELANDREQPKVDPNHRFLGKQLRVRLQQSNQDATTGTIPWLAG